MTRNFCGYVDFNHKIPNHVIGQMYENLNFDKQYTTERRKLGRTAVFASLQSNTLSPFEKESVFLNKMSDKYIITAYALLINVKELCALLETDFYPSINHEEIILRAYLKWGKSCSEKLLGDWTFAIWDHENQELVLSMSQTGENSLFYAFHNGVLYFSTLIAGLVNIDGVKLHLDQEKVFTEFCQYMEFEDRTIYREIKFLYMGHFLTFNKNQQIKIKQYWDLKQRSETRFKTDEEYTKAFYDIYKRGVNKIMELPVNWMGTLSGGLDSSSTTYLASEYLKKQDKKLDVFSYVQYFKDFDALGPTKRSGDEKPFIDLLAKANSNINVNFVKRRPEGFIDFLGNNFDSFKKPPNTIHFWWFEEIGKMAKQSGKGNGILSAEGGNSTVSYEGRSSNHDISLFLEDMSNGLNKHANVSQKFMLMLKAIYGSYDNYKRGTKTGKNKNLKKYLDFRTFINDDFYDRVNGEDIMNYFVFEKNKQYNTHQKILFNQLSPFSCRHGISNEVGSKYDLIYNLVPRSVEMFEFISSIPNHQFNRLGNQKFLFKRAFKGKLPDEVVFNDKKALQVSDIVSILRADIEVLQHTVEQIKKSPLCQSMLDMKALNALLDKLLNPHYLTEKFTYEVFRKSNSLTLAMYLLWLEKENSIISN
ncbi:asparagine synthase-related protein [Wenyingzhuangia sp. IMCC45533]